MPNQRLERPRAREDRLRSRRTGHACVRGLKLIVRLRAAIEYYDYEQHGDDRGAAAGAAKEPLYPDNSRRDAVSK